MLESCSRQVDHRNNSTATQRFHKPLWGRRSPEIVPLFLQRMQRNCYQWSTAVKTRRWCSPPAWATPPAQPFQPNKFSETMVASVILHQVCLPTYPNLHGHICCFQTAFSNCGRFQAVVTFEIETMPSFFVCRSNLCRSWPIRMMKIYEIATFMWVKYIKCNYINTIHLVHITFPYNPLQSPISVRAVAKACSAM